MIMIDVDETHLMIFIIVYIGFLEYILPLSDFAARKCCHAGCGLGMMQLDPFSFNARVFVWIVAVSSIAMTWELSPLPPFRVSRPKDVGITAYLSLVSVWFYFNLSPVILAPVFIADPSGAIVGKFCSRNFPKYNLAWYQNKTIAGSAAVFFFTFVSITFPCTDVEKFAIALVATVAEALGGDYDNLALAAVVLAGWQLTAA
jgi:hypothetical protein